MLSIGKYWTLIGLLFCGAFNQLTTGQGVHNNTSPAKVFDSINNDLKEIKETLFKTLKESKASNWFDLAPELGDYLEKGSETKDRPFTTCFLPTDNDNLFKYSIPRLNESEGEIKFSDYKGKVILLVNVATFCESTIEYPMYNQLVDEYGDRLAIFGFPCNQFWNQEPTDSAEEIYNAIKYVRPGNGFVPKFPLTKRIDVNGPNKHPVYSLMTRSCPSTRTRYTKNEQYLLYSPRNTRDIRWNFEKFLIHPITGYAVRRYDQKFHPDRIKPDIEELLKLTKQN